MNSFLGLIHKEENSSYGICFPDVLGCISVGDTFEEALSNGREALEFHLEMMAKDGNGLPKARSYEKLLQDPETMELAEDAIWVFIENIAIAKAA
jgi:predicted RNase H-like HicB family nuclease